MNIALLVGLLISTAPSPTPMPKEAPVLEFGGSPGIEFHGVCVSKEGAQQRAIGGVTPSKVTLDFNIERCSVKRRSSKGGFTVRLFHQGKLLVDKSIDEPSTGLEIVIPFF